MGLSYDCASSILLCAEDNNSILCFEDEVEVEEEEEEEAYNWAPHHQRCGLYEDMLVSFPLQSDECLDLMVKKEAEHLPREDYRERLITGGVDLAIRRDAIDWILKVHAYYNFGPVSAYLSVNYLDRFLSAYELPKGKDWMTQLLSVVCLSLAAKLEETQVPLCLDLQVGGSKYVFEAKTVQRMELLVLSTLKWRMQAVTPFSFIDYFLHKFNDGKSSNKSLLSRSVQIILGSARGCEFLAFRPSEIAAAAALSVLEETQVVEVDKALTSCNHVDKERVVRCYQVIQEVILKSDAAASVSFVPQSPNGVLDAASCLICNKSDDTTTIGSHSNSHLCSSPATKRNKICISF